MTTPEQLARPHRPLPLVAVAGFLALSVAVWLAVNLASLATGGTWLSLNPLAIGLELALGTVPWPGPWAAVLLVVELILVAGTTVFLRRGVLRRRRGDTRVDAQARHMADDAELELYTPQAVQASAQRLRPRGVDATNPAEHGILLGVTLPRRTDIRATWEDTIVQIWGPRTGKTTSQAIPAIVNAPGTVVTTSNKRDLHDATRGVREQVGSCWVFDPQNIIGHDRPGMWFDPLCTVSGPREAAELASHFVAGSTSADAKRDAYFDTEGEALLSYFFLAAARVGKPITAVYHWASDSRDRTAAAILHEAGDLVATKLDGIIDLPDKQRDGVYASALRLLKCLEDPRVLRWVTPPQHWPEYRHDPDSAPTVPRFDPEHFLRTDSRDTLYLQSREGEASAGPLVAALTFAVLTTGEQLATTRPGARLDPPLACVLDEAANVVRIRQLPDLYSHYGSRGIVPMTILQSWEQGVDAWGRSGMQKLWDAANHRVYGGGIRDSDWLGKIAQQVGEHDEVTYSSSVDRTGMSGSRQASTRQQQTLKVADLGALPRGRIVVLSSGVPTTMLEPVPWMSGDHAEEIRASIATYGPAAQETTPR